MKRATDCPIHPTLLVLVGAMCLFAAYPAAAQFSAREGYTADGAYHWSFELAPYVYLPAVDARIGLNHPPGSDITFNQPRPTIAKLLDTLTGAFVGYALVRYGPYSGEINIDYIAAQQKRNFPPLLPGGAGATLTADASYVRVSPGIGFEVLPTTNASKFAVDARAGFSYYSLSASASFERDPFGGVNRDISFAQPWIGARATYYPSTHWRIGLDAALMGLGVDGGTMGWNARLGVSYLIAKWFDVTLGYAAIQTNRNVALGPRGENRSVDLLAYGPFLAIGFRF